MTRENKELLLKDLCVRLPYFIKVQIKNEIVILDSICYDDGYYFNFIGDDREGVNIESIKPYLFPLSSMTKEQLYELREAFGFEIEFGDGVIELSTFHHGRLGYLEMVSIFEWFNQNHYDYRGLIEKGLAIDCTNLNIY